MKKKNNFDKSDEKKYFTNVTDFDELNFFKQIFDNSVNNFCDECLEK